jgi:hypothetical protein
LSAFTGEPLGQIQMHWFFIALANTIMMKLAEVFALRPGFHKLISNKIVKLNIFCDTL